MFIFGKNVILGIFGPFRHFGGGGRTSKMSKINEKREKTRIFRFFGPKIAKKCKIDRISKFSIDFGHKRYFFMIFIFLVRGGVLKLQKSRIFRVLGMGGGKVQKYHNPFK